MPPTLDSTLLFANKTASGYTPTLVSRLGAMLSDAENMYGPRDQTYTILGIEFGRGIPSLWYPGDCKHIAIQLDTKAMSDLSQACYQLAHECVHLLCPTGGSKTNNLEEGLASYNSTYYMKTHMNQPDWNARLSSYADAEALVKKIMDDDACAIKRMRQLEFNISKITSCQILNESSAVSKTEAEFLASNFRR